MRMGALGRGGFTFVELLMAMLVTAILAGIAVPMYGGATRRAEAARVISDVHTIHQALREHLVDEARLPDTAAPGEIPAGLEPYLPEGFRFEAVSSVYRYRNWGHSGGAGSGIPQAGVEVHSSDQAFLRALEGLSQGRAALVTGGSLTLLLE